MVELLQRYSKLARLPTFTGKTTIRPAPIAAPRIHNAGKRLGPDVMSELVAAYKSGSSTTMLMKRYCLGKGTVLTILREAGVIRQQRHPSPEQIDDMVKLYQQGWSLAKIGRYYDFNHGSVWLWLKERGVPMRKSWEH